MFYICNYFLSKDVFVVNNSSLFSTLYFLSDIASCKLKIKYLEDCSKEKY